MGSGRGVDSTVSSFSLGLMAWELSGLFLKPGCAVFAIEFGVNGGWRRGRGLIHPLVSHLQNMES